MEKDRWCIVGNTLYKNPSKDILKSVPFYQVIDIIPGDEGIIEEIWWVSPVDLGKYSCIDFAYPSDKDKRGSLSVSKVRQDFFKRCKVECNFLKSVKLPRSQFKKDGIIF